MSRDESDVALDDTTSCDRRNLERPSPRIRRLRVAFAGVPHARSPSVHQGLFSDFKALSSFDGVASPHFQHRVRERVLEASASIAYKATAASWGELTTAGEDVLYAKNRILSRLLRFVLFLLSGERSRKEVKKSVSTCRIDAYIATDWTEINGGVGEKKSPDRPLEKNRGEGYICIKKNFFSFLHLPTNGPTASNRRLEPFALFVPTPCKKGKEVSSGRLSSEISGLLFSPAERLVPSRGTEGPRRHHCLVQPEHALG